MYSDKLEKGAHYIEASWKPGLSDQVLQKNDLLKDTNKEQMKKICKKLEYI